jgi:molecular chaperone Hsp33
MTIGIQQHITEGILPFYLDYAQTKGRLVRLGPEVDKLLAQHQYPHFINRYVAEVIALTAALSVDVKYEGTFTVQIAAQANQPSIIRLVVVDLNTQGHVRAYARWDDALLEQTISHLCGDVSLERIFGNALLTFTADLAEQTKRYQAIVELSGSTLAESMHHFFRQSDQIPTGIILHSQAKPDQGQITSAALILQRLPYESDLAVDEVEKHDDDWITNLSLLGTLTKNELLDAGLGNEELLHRLFHEHSLHIAEFKPLIAKCSCSKERLQKIIDSFSADEQQRIAENGVIKAVCEFCNAEYSFNILKKL